MPILGAWGDVYGRKTNMILGIAGFSVGILAVICLADNPYLPIWMLPIVVIFVGLTGFTSIVPISCFAYLADITTSGEQRTIRMAYFAGCTTASQILAGLAGGLIVGSWGLKWFAVLSLGFLCVGYFYCLLRLEQLPPTLMKHKAILAKARREGGKEVEMSPPPGGEMEERDTSITGFAKTVYQLLKEAIKAYIKPRKGYRRAFVILIAVVYVLYLSANQGIHGSITALYGTAKPLRWKAKDVSYWRSGGAAIGVVGKVGGAYVFKRFFKWRDTTLILVSLCSVFTEMMLMSFVQAASSQKGAEILMWSAAAAGIFSPMAFPTFKAFLGSIVAPNEVGKVFTILGIAVDFAAIMTAVVYTNIFSLTLQKDVYAGTVYYCVSASVVVCFCIILWIHIMLKREKDEDDEK